MTFREYDLSRLAKLAGGTVTGLVITAVLHHLKGFIVPLVIQTRA
jgi:hypothetical protein